MTMATSVPHDTTSARTESHSTAAHPRTAIQATVTAGRCGRHVLALSHPSTRR